MKLRIPWFVRLLVSAAVLTVLLMLVPLGTLWDAMRSVPLVLWLGTLAAFLAAHVVAAFKWRALLSRHVHVPVSMALRAHFAGLVANLALPGAAGGDVVRAGWVMRQTGRIAGVGVASAADRVLDTMALFLMAFAGAIWTAQLNDVIGQALLVGAAALVFVGAAGGAAYFWLARRPADSKLGNAAQAMRILVQHPGLLLRTLLLSLAVQGSLLGLNILLGQAAGIDVPAGAWLVAWPLAKLVACIPLSLAGLGVREAALVVFMRPFGAPAAAVTAVGLLWQAVLICGGLVGSVLVPLASGKHQPTDSVPAGMDAKVSEAIV